MMKNPLLPSTLNLPVAQWRDAASVADLALKVCTADGDPTIAPKENELIAYWKDESGQQVCDL